MEATNGSGGGQTVPWRTTPAMWGRSYLLALLRAGVIAVVLLSALAAVILF
jgi:hypothetical protein